MARCLSVSWHMCILWIFISQESRSGYIFIWGNVEHLAISLKLYELDPSTLSISVVVMHEMGVFINSNRSVGSGGLFMHVSLTDIMIVSTFYNSAMNFSNCFYQNLTFSETFSFAAYCTANNFLIETSIATKFQLQIWQPCFVPFSVKFRVVIALLCICEYAEINKVPIHIWSS